MTGLLPWLAANAVELLTLLVTALGLLVGAGYFRWRITDRDKRQLEQENATLENRLATMRDQRDDAWKRLKQVDLRTFLENLEKAREDRAFEYETTLAREFLTARSPAIAEASRILAEEQIMADAEAEDTVLEALRYVTVGLTARPHDQRLNALRNELTTVKRRYEDGAGPASRPLDGLTGVELNQLSKKLQQQGRYTAAELAARRCADLVYATEGRGVNFATVIGQHGNIVHSLGRLDEAEALHRAAKDIRADQLGTAHSDYARSLNNLAAVLHDKGEVKEAEKLYREAKDIDADKLGTTHPDYATTLNNLGEVLRDKGDLDAAETLHRKARAIRADKLGTDHPDYAATLNNLALVLRDQGDLAEAEKHLREAKDIQAKKLGTDHPNYAKTLDNLGGVLRTKGDLDAAETLYREARAIRVKKLGTDHPDYAVTLNNLATVLRDKGETDEAAALAAEALAAHTAALGSDHAHTQTSKRILESIRATSA